MSVRVVSWWRRLLDPLDQHAPMPPDQHAERERGGPDDAAERQLQVRIRSLGKRGNDGYR